MTVELSTNQRRRVGIEIASPRIPLPMAPWCQNWRPHCSPFECSVRDLERATDVSEEGFVLERLEQKSTRAVLQSGRLQAGRGSSNASL